MHCVDFYHVCVTGSTTIDCALDPLKCRTFCPPRSRTDPAAFAAIYNFAGGPADGASPVGGLIQGSDGMFYGTTANGGSTPAGTVFRLAPDGSGLTILHHFTGGAADGANPVAGLIQGPDGTLYGTTGAGGSANLGTVFQMAPDGSNFAIVHHFTGGAMDGARPYGSLVQGPDGTLYGTTSAGGSANLGTVFQMAPDGSGFNILHQFQSGALDGTLPNAGLIQGPDGTLYGTTLGGGGGSGTIFRIAPDGSGYAILHVFTGAPADGADPYAGLLQGPDGTLYGTTRTGGSANLGTVFLLAPDGSGFAVLYSFMGNPTDGAYPYAGLIQGPDGTLYGSTANGGTNRVVGTIFRMAPDGSGYSQLHVFTVDPADGAVPFGSLIQTADGTLYGTTFEGGMNGAGMVFQVSTGS